MWYGEFDREVIYIAAATGSYHNCEAGAAFGILYNSFRSMYQHEAARCIRGQVTLQDALLQVRGRGAAGCATQPDLSTG